MELYSMELEEKVPGDAAHDFQARVAAAEPARLLRHLPHPRGVAEPAGDGEA